MLLSGDKIKLSVIYVFVANKRYSVSIYSCICSKKKHEEILK
jgi:hypothetical protein